MAARTGPAAVAYAKRVSRYRPPGMCQQFTRVSFGVGARFGSARLAWLGAKKKHYVSRGADVPAGVPVYWLGGKHGHAAVSIGGGLCRSTDWPYAGHVGTARIDDISRAWNRRLVGWTEDINGVVIPGADGHHADPKRTIDVSEVVKAVKASRAITNGIVLKGAVAREVGKGKMNLASPVLGSGFKRQYALLQAKFLTVNNERVTSKATDGVPGQASLRWLAKRHDIDLKA